MASNKFFISTKDVMAVEGIADNTARLHIEGYLIAAGKHADDVLTIPDMAKAKNMSIEKVCCAYNRDVRAFNWKAMWDCIELRNGEMWVK